MQPRSAAEIREGFQRFFEERGHTRVPPAPLLAKDDPTLLFVNSGMAPFKRVLTGEEKRDYTRAVDSQPCLRVAGKHNDFEEVGRTPRHHTFFEMLGNWSFGDYFKRDAIAWAWEYLTDELGIPAERLAATVYTDDDEAARLWADEVGLPADRIVRWGNIAVGDDHNFWAMGETGPCGPCSELHYDRGAELSEGPECVPDHSETCPRWLEVWNLVFMEYDRSADGVLTPLPFKSVDTGMGLERISSVAQGVDSNYKTDLFEPIIARLAAFIGHDPVTVESERFSYQVVADHSRAMTFLIAQGVSPSNEGAGYVLRRIMRRAVRHGRLMGIERPFLAETCDAVIEVMAGAYPELADGRERVLAEVRSEEAKFARTLAAGSQRLLALVEGTGVTISGEEAFRLHDTFGFPIDLTVEMAAEQGATVDRGGFEAAMQAQRERSRGARAGRFTAAASLAELESGFIGYPNETSGYGRVLGVAEADGVMHVVLDRSPFYAEGGGQIGDRGTLAGDRGRLVVEDTQRAGQSIVHVGRLEGELVPGEVVERAGRRGAPLGRRAQPHRNASAAPGAAGRRSASRPGRPAAGSGPMRCASTSRPRRHAACGLAPNRGIVNAQIRRNATVIPRSCLSTEAQSLGADMFFGEKYAPAAVRVVRWMATAESCAAGPMCRRPARSGPCASLRVEHRCRAAADRGGDRCRRRGACRAPAGGAPRRGTAARRSRGERAAARRGAMARVAKLKRPRTGRGAAAARLDAREAIQDAEKLARLASWSGPIRKPMPTHCAPRDDLRAQPDASWPSLGERQAGRR